ncbi:hypothetical protein [Marimonas arenosa]|uniref:Uncharacterized protein n=1 Tax=Marimonas arenosa TaxID=1795305 RepID=A0AAE3WF36_9RHOB|nr:hypothetical protein [Marimonas arenosa]MDQ2091557.1 hypothetical protein [Marimonas arenosa]
MVDWKTDTKPDYEHLCMAFLETYALDLKKALVENGMSEKKAEPFIETAVFCLAMIFDQGRIRLSEKPFKPVLGFRDQVGQIDNGPRVKKFDLHDYAIGMVSSAFDGNDW